MSQDLFVGLTLLEGIKKRAEAGRSEVLDARRSAELHGLLLISVVKEVDIGAPFREIQIDISSDPTRRNPEKTSIDATKNTKLCESAEGTARPR